MTRSLARFVAVASVAAIAVVATGCSSSLDNAATMSGGHITNTGLRNELNNLLDNKDFVVTEPKPPRSLALPGAPFEPCRFRAPAPSRSWPG